MEKKIMHNYQNHRYHPYQQCCEPQRQPQQQLHHHPTMANNSVNQGDSESQFLVERETFLRRLPPGYKFCPTDAESLDYLKKKVNHLQLPIDMIPQVDVYKYSPQQLAGMYKLHRANAWYFFTARERKYRNGRRPSRSTGDSGFWKPTGTDNTIHDKDKNIAGYKRHLDYYERKAPKGEVKTDWKMHEYRLEKESDHPKNTGTESSMQLDGLVLCKVYINSRKKKNDEEGDAEENSSVDDVGPVEEGGGDAEEYYSGENSWLVGGVRPQCESRISRSARLEFFSSGPVTFWDSDDSIAGQVNDGQPHLRFNRLVNEGNMLPLPMSYQKHPAAPSPLRVVREPDYQKYPAAPRPLTVVREPDYATQQMNRTGMEIGRNATLALPISSVLQTFPNGTSPNHDQGADHTLGFQHHAQLGVPFSDLQDFINIEECYN